MGERDHSDHGRGEKNQPGVPFQSDRAKKNKIQLEPMTYMMG